MQIRMTPYSFTVGIISVSRIILFYGWIDLGSGHGIQVDDLDGDEIDGKDEGPVS
jgi:hypothetical protein